MKSRRSVKLSPHLELISTCDLFDTTEELKKALTVKRGDRNIIVASKISDALVTALEGSDLSTIAHVISIALFDTAA